MAGRTPKPTALHLVNGTRSQVGRGKGKADGHEPEPQVLLDLTPPDHLPESAKVVWREMAPKLRRAGLLTELDTFELEKLCVSVARYRKLTEQTEEVQLQANLETGAVSISPRVLLQQMYANQANHALGKFGMNPADRARIIVNPQGDLFPGTKPAANSPSRFFKQ